jgi:hypothetical protein
MPVTNYYSITPDIGLRRYSEIADQISPQALYTLDLMRRLPDPAPFTFVQIERASLDANRFHTGALLERCLVELVGAKCLIVEELDTARAD